MEFPICKGGGGSDGFIFHMFSATHQNASKAILSIFRHFFFLCDPHLELPKNHFKDVKKVADFPYVRREEGWSTNIWKIAYVFCRYFLKASLREVLNQKKV